MTSTGFNIFFLIVAFGLRAAFAIYLNDHIIQVDEVGIEAAAWQIVSGIPDHRAGDTEALRAALVYIVSAFYWIFGRHPIIPRLFQALLSTWLAWFIGRMTARMTCSERAGRMAFSVSAIYPFFVYYSGVLMSETLYLSLMTAGIWALCEDPDNIDTGIVAGTLLGLGSVVRPEGTYIVLGIFLLLLVLRSWTVRTSAAAAAWALPVLLWCGGNLYKTGSFSQDLHGGITLLHGTVFFDLDQDKGTGATMQVLDSVSPGIMRLGEAEKDAAYKQWAMEYMKAHPATIIRQWAMKAVNFWRFYPRYRDYDTRAGTNPSAGSPRWLLVLASLAFEPAIIMLGGVGLFALWRLQRDRMLPIVSFVAGTFVIHVLVVSQMRYRLPVMPFLIAAMSWVVAL